MLAILDTANSDGVPQLGTDFLVASIELIDDQSFRVWFTRPVASGNNPANYHVTGPSTVSVVAAQYELDRRGARVYLSTALSVGQWTVGFSSGPPTTLLSDDSDHLALPSNTQVVFDLVDKSSQDEFGNALILGPVAKFIPKAFRTKKVFAAIIDGLEAGDAIVSTQARLALDQYFVSTASGKYLTTRAADRGIPKPVNLGISDVDFRKLAIDVANNKLTSDALLSILEIFFGEDSVKAYVETALAEPFEIFDGAFLDFLIDEKTEFHFVANWKDYQTPLRATALELVSAFNFAFDKSGIRATAVVDSGKVKIYSNTKGIRSSISVQGGTLQPLLQFDSAIYGPALTSEAFALQWTLSNPQVGTVRFVPQTPTPLFAGPVLKIGDYVTIIGSNFPTALRGSWPVTDVNFTWGVPAPTEWFEIASDYIVP
jgi:hypothetical protein